MILNRYESMMRYYHAGLMWAAREEAQQIDARWSAQLDAEYGLSLVKDHPEQDPDSSLESGQLAMVSSMAHLPTTPRMALEERLYLRFEEIMLMHDERGWQPLLSTLGSLHDQREAAKMMRTWLELQDEDDDAMWTAPVLALIEQEERALEVAP